MDDQSFRTIWSKLGDAALQNETAKKFLGAFEPFLNNEKIFDPIAIAQALPAFLQRLTFSKTGLAIITRDAALPETLTTAASLASELGLKFKMGRNLEPVIDRETLVTEFIDGGYEMLLMLDHDVLIQSADVLRLVYAMERTGAALVSALVATKDGSGLNAWEEPAEDSDEPIRVTKANILSSGSPFPVMVGGLSACLLDLRQIKEIPSPRFMSKTEGKVHWSDEVLFCKLLKKYEMNCVVDPQVNSFRFGKTGFFYKWVSE